MAFLSLFSFYKLGNWTGVTINDYKGLVFISKVLPAITYNYVHAIIVSNDYINNLSKFDEDMQFNQVIIMIVP